RFPISVAAVEPRDIHPGFDERLDLALRIDRRAEGADYLGAPHGSQLCEYSFQREPKVSTIRLITAKPPSQNALSRRSTPTISIRSCGVLQPPSRSTWMYFSANSGPSSLARSYSERVSSSPKE